MKPYIPRNDAADGDEYRLYTVACPSCGYGADAVPETELGEIIARHGRGYGHTVKVSEETPVLFG